MICKCQRSVDCLLGRMFPRDGVAEIGEHFASPAFRHSPAVTVDDGGGVAAIRIYDGEQFFRITQQTGSCRGDQFGGESGYVASLRVIRWHWRRRSSRLLRFRRRRFRLLHFGCELVTAAGDGDDQGWVPGIRLYLTA
jgi:hypothetical protein